MLIFNGALGGTAALVPELAGLAYVAYLLPFTLITAVLDSPGGQAMVRDLSSGYFDKLLLTPIRRIALVLGHIIASGLVAVVVAVALVGLGLLIVGWDARTLSIGLLASVLVSLLPLGFALASLRARTRQR